MVTAEQKLQLIHFLREDHKNNRIQLHRREQILYGTGGMENIYDDSAETFYKTKENDTYKGKGISGFRVRFLISLILFLSFFYLDRSNIDSEYVNLKQFETYMDDNSLQHMVINVFDFNE